MRREMLAETELPEFIAYCELRGWEQINLPGASLIDMKRHGRGMLTIAAQGPREGVYVLYDEAARMAEEWRA
jgi:hypothetical protein